MWHLSQPWLIHLDHTLPFRFDTIGSWWDKGYFGVKPLGFDATMKRGVRNHSIGIWDKLRNKRISRKRSPGERPYAVIKTVFKSAHTMVTTIVRVHVKMIFAALSFNISLIRTFKHRGVMQRMLSLLKKDGRF
jgi:hypothetical protein